ncbi:MFS transporter [Streptomyces beihaiensis]|uniref:MFS transporter n=1 Tax=Streptomyces beihaiensis TaxID=2984495 RepID=A0ABT3U1G0_9ACTN|nr:MFS transporter [Streptomyces beihaiensis]MCX3063129.1 MFS transporter [Streptomyces beihaiensis]
MSGTSTATGPLRRRQSAARPRVNRWVVLVVLCTSLLLVALDSTILYVALPSVTESLKPTSVELLWIGDAYPLVCASLLILFGTLGDRVGRRKILLLGYALFGAASALAVLADSAQVLITARALLGIGGAMIMPATLSILRDVFPDRHERAVAIGVWTAVAAVGAATGPVLGGFLVEHFWWGSVFLINIPLMAVMLPVCRLLVPESKGRSDGPWDLFGALVAALGVLGVVYGIKEWGTTRHLFEGRAALPFLAGALLLVLFVRRQRRRAHPLIDMRLFAKAAFSTSVGCIVIAMLALVGLELIAVQYLQLVLGLSPLETGLRMLPLTFAAMAAGVSGSANLRRFGPRRMVSCGFALTALAVLLLVLMGAHDRPLLLGFGFILLGFGFQSTLFGAYESMLSEAPADEAGGAAAIGETSYQLGAGMGIALLGSVMNAAYAPALGHARTVPEAARHAAGNSLGEAYQVADRLGGPAGDALRTAARTAFVHGLHVTLVVSAALLLLGALAARRLPRMMECDAPAAPAEPDLAATEPASTEPAATKSAAPDLAATDLPAKGLAARDVAAKSAAAKGAAATKLPQAEVTARRPASRAESSVA